MEAIKTLLILRHDTAQELLNALGFSAGPADGLMGPRTADAIRQFQSRAGLSATGRVTSELIATLEAALTN